MGGIFFSLLLYYIWYVIHSMPGYDTYEFREPYKDINTTLYWLVEQAKTGIEYCREKFPPFDNPIQAYNYIKPMLTYKNDPPGKELIQSPGTLLEDNYHGVPGAGDCDCFVCLWLAVAWANGWPGARIVLTGRRKNSPQHIYILQKWGRDNIVIDFTEPVVNQERVYPYKQVLNSN